MVEYVVIGFFVLIIGVLLIKINNLKQQLNRRNQLSRIPIEVMECDESRIIGGLSKEGVKFLFNQKSILQLRISCTNLQNKQPRGDYTGRIWVHMTFKNKKILAMHYDRAAEAVSDILLALQAIDLEDFYLASESQDSVSTSRLFKTEEPKKLLVSS